jgi:hypothetical protein
VVIENREAWDKQMNDWREFFRSPDYSYMRLGFNFKSPAPLIADRDFYLLQMARRDWPQKGDFALVQKSLPPSSECANIKGRVRATAHFIAQIWRPTVDQKTGESRTEVFMCSCIDINGQVPKILVNTMSNSVPRENFGKFEAACIAWQSNEFFKKYIK